MKKIDLHSHSTASDGTYSPSELIIEAKNRGVEVIALTDHDNIDGIEEARKKSLELGIEFVNGIEFSTEYLGKEIHILGYYYDEKNEKFLKLIEKLKIERENRTRIILEKLAKYKCYITMEELKKEVKGNLISRAHIANVMINKGFVYSKSEAFKIYLRAGGLASEPRKELDPIEAVKIIKEIGGISSLAHPKLTGFKEKELEELIGKLKENGLNALEACYPEHKPSDEKKYKELCIKYDLLYTGGSDFHGLNRPENLLGVNGIEYNEFEGLKRLKKML